MSSTMETAGNGAPHAGSPRQLINLVATLWDIERRHQFGGISRSDYLWTVRALRKGFANGNAIASAKEKIDE